MKPLMVFLATSPHGRGVLGAGAMLTGMLALEVAFQMQCAAAAAHRSGTVRRRPASCAAALT